MEEAHRQHSQRKYLHSRAFCSVVKIKSDYDSQWLADLLGQNGRLIKTTSQAMFYSDESEGEPAVAVRVARECARSREPGKKDENQ